MTDEQLQKLFVLLHRPIPWDPIPWWIKISKEKLEKFNKVQLTLNTKIAELEAEKLKQLSEIAGFKM